jgi:hypothetical protein
MQKIQLYLLPIRIKVVVDQDGANTEFRQVYQKTIKLYKGIDNKVEFDLRNSEQKRVDVFGKSLIVDFFDLERKKLFSVRALPAPAKSGIMVADISSLETELLEPQKLTGTALLESEEEDTIVYADTQFGLSFSVELLDGYNSRYGDSDIVDTLDTFNYEFDRKAYVSEIGMFGQKFNHDYSTKPDASITVEYQGDFRGIMRVEATNTMSTAYGVRWTDLGEWDTTLENQKIFVGEYKFIRFIAPKYTDDTYQTLTGTVDRIIIRN